MSNRPMALLALLSLIWGSEWIASIVLDGLPRLRVIAIRCFFAALMLLPFALSRESRRLSLDYGRNCLLGLGIIGVPVLLSTQAKNISSGLSVVLFAATPLIATVMEGGTGITGAPYLLGGLLGIAFLVRTSLSFSSSQGLSILWITLAVFCLAFFMVKARQWLPGQNKAGAILVQMLTAAATIGLYSFIREDRNVDPWTPAQMVVVALLGVAGSAVAYLIFYQLLTVRRASQVAVLQWLTPIVGVLEAALWLRHFPAWEKIVGGTLAIACAVMMLRLQPSDAGTTADELKPLTLKITLP